MSDRRTADGEPLFTLEEAKRELALAECASAGHSYEVVSSATSDKPDGLRCSRCGRRWKLLDVLRQQEILRLLDEIELNGELDSPVLGRAQEIRELLE